MLGELRMGQPGAKTREALVAALLLLAGGSAGVFAQQTGPLKAPPASSAQQNGPGTVAVQQTPDAGPKAANSNITNEPPALPAEQIIQKFAAREAEFKKERDNYTYTQTFVIQTIDPDGVADGEYQMRSDILFTPDGKRYEKVVYAPASTLQRISMSQQDLDDLEHVQPFVLTTEELPKYDIKYVGREKIDELSTYVFDVGPKKLEKNQRYFQGRVWVDDADLEIVKSDGKAVPDIKKKGQENVFPRFETFRENIEGHYWFPTYTRADDMLQFSTGGVHIRMTVKYANYKRFGVTIKIGSPSRTEPEKP
jgi:hypothetical protein